MKTSLLHLLAGLAFVGMTSCGDTKAEEKKVDAPTELEVQSKAAEKVPSKGYDIGATATDFSLKNVDGKMISLADYKDAKGYIVIFTCNHCPYAKAYETRIIDIDKKYAHKGFPVIAINPNDPTIQPEDSYEAMISNAKEKGFTFPYLIDEKQEIYTQYGATKTPHVYLLLKENGNNVVKYIGAIDDNFEKPNEVKVKYLENAVDALLAGKAIDQTKTAAIGCTIKDKRNEKK